jgi:hypothetical protein
MNLPEHPNLDLGVPRPNRNGRDWKIKRPELHPLNHHRI